MILDNSAAEETDVRVKQMPLNSIQVIFNIQFEVQFGGATQALEL